MAKKIKDATKIDWKALEKKEGEVVNTGMGADVIKLEKDESFIGQYIGSEVVELSNYDPFTSFKFLTESGEKAFSGGMNFEQQMRMVNIGAIIRVTHKGKKKIQGSKNKMNQFSIVALTPDAINEKERAKIQSEIKIAMKKKKTTKKGKK